MAYVPYKVTVTTTFAALIEDWDEEFIPPSSITDAYEEAVSGFALEVFNGNSEYLTGVVAVEASVERLGDPIV